MAKDFFRFFPIFFIHESLSDGRAEQESLESGYAYAFRPRDPQSSGQAKQGCLDGG